MSFFTTLIRCLFLALGVLAALFGTVLLATIPSARTEGIRRRATLIEASRLVEIHRAQSGRLPKLITIETGDIQPVRISVSERPHRSASTKNSPAGFQSTDFTLEYSTPNADSVDTLDSRTGRTSLDDTGIPHYLVSPLVLLAVSAGFFRMARWLLEKPVPLL